MEIKPEHIRTKEVVGKLRGNPVTRIRTIGGFEALICVEGNNVKVLGGGPHIGVANFMAKKNHPEVMFTKLQKSEIYPSYRLERDAEPWYDVVNKLNVELGNK